MRDCVAILFLNIHKRSASPTLLLYTFSRVYKVGLTRSVFPSVLNRRFEPSGQTDGKPDRLRVRTVGLDGGPIWTYGIELWGSTKPSNSSRIQSLQSKILRKILNTSDRLGPTYEHDLGLNRNQN
ncbi:unnamed protein product [Nezara viridula]|uniref:Uncharacterized protein n=1 Tax=Nezara viridula TaxID=85310 RepID=A0A9P0EBJ8_NEZVI|nr:unnamed protein product [Nezara viridula]